LFLSQASCNLGLRFHLLVSIVDQRLLFFQPFGLLCSPLFILDTSFLCKYSLALSLLLSQLLFERLHLEPFFFSKA
jgi:hypothetical protein